MMMSSWGDSLTVPSARWAMNPVDRPYSAGRNSRNKRTTACSSARPFSPAWLIVARTASSFAPSAASSRRAKVLKSGVSILIVSQSRLPLRPPNYNSAAGCTIYHQMQASTAGCLHLDVDRADASRCGCSGRHPPSDAGAPAIRPSSPRRTTSANRNSHSFRSAFHLPPAAFTRCRGSVSAKATRTATTVSSEIRGVGGFQSRSATINSTVLNRFLRSGS